MANGEILLASEGLVKTVNVRGMLRLDLVCGGEAERQKLRAGETARKEGVNSGRVFRMNFLEANQRAVTVYQLGGILCCEWRKVENPNVRSGAG